MNNLSNLTSAALVFASMTATALVLQACGASAQAQTAQATPTAQLLQTANDIDVIEGVWESSVTLNECSTGNAIVAFKAATLFSHGGTLNADDSFPTPSRGAAFGIWKHGAGKAYTAQLRFMRYGPDGAMIGSQKVSRSITMGDDGNSLSATITAQIIDPDGAVLQQVCGHETAGRVY